ncbi:MAG TPA: L-rhamnose/proton symporter RhaT [Terriglobales bacterium]
MNLAIGGILVLVVAGITNGSFTLPMKFTRQWEWENTWLIYTIWALVIFPPVLTWLTVPGLGGVYSQTPDAHHLIAIVALCGAGWGASQIFFGLAVEGVGIALAFSIILGLAAAVGSLVPLLRQHPDQIFQPLGLQVLAGVGLVLVGVGICALAGRRREAAQRTSMPQASAMKGAAAAAEMAIARRPSLWQGLGFCAISGVGSALVNIGFSEGQPLLDFAHTHGASAAWAPNAVWLPLMLAGGVPGLIYCGYLIAKNHTGNRFSRGGTASYWLLAGVMSLFWFGSTLLYGIGAGMLGNLGTVLGWPVFMSLIVITANVLGLLTGEWKGTGGKPVRIMVSGLAVLIAAIVVLSRAS